MTQGSARAARPPWWFLVALAASYVAVLALVGFVVADRRPPDLALLGAGLVAVVVLVGWRVLRWRDRGRTLFRARPRTPVPRRFVAGARIAAAADAIVVSNGTTTQWVLPAPGRAGGPVALRPGRLADPGQGPVTRVALVGADGAVLLHLGRAEWCGDGSEQDLADALGVVWESAPVPALDMVAQPAVSPVGLSVLDPQPLLVPGIVAFWVTLWSLGGDGPTAWLTVAVATSAFVAGPVGSFGLLVRASRGRREVTPAPSR